MPVAPPNDLTSNEVERLATATAQEIDAGRKADLRTTAWESARKWSAAESQRWKRREFLVRQQLEGLTARAEQIELEVTELDAQRDVLASERDALKAALAKAGQRTGHAVLPYKGANGTWRRPIVLECTTGGVKLQPQGMRFTSMEMSPFIHPRASPFVQAIIREMRHIELAETPDGAPAIPYLVFLVRPEGIRYYYEARTRLEPLGIAFGYELIEQDLVVDVPNFDDLTTWDGTVPLDVPLEPAPGPRSSVVQRSGRDSAATGDAPDSTGSGTGAAGDLSAAAGSSRSRGPLGGRPGGDRADADGDSPADFVWPGRGGTTGAAHRRKAAAHSAAAIRSPAAAHWAVPIGSPAAVALGGGDQISGGSALGGADRVAGGAALGSGDRVAGGAGSGFAASDPRGGAGQPPALGGGFNVRGGGAASSPGPAGLGSASNRTGGAGDNFGDLPPSNSGAGGQQGFGQAGSSLGAPRGAAAGAGTGGGVGLDVLPDLEPAGDGTSTRLPPPRSGSSFGQPFGSGPSAGSSGGELALGQPGMNTQSLTATGGAPGVDASSGLGTGAPPTGTSTSATGVMGPPPDFGAAASGQPPPMPAAGGGVAVDSGQGQGGNFGGQTSSASALVAGASGADPPSAEPSQPGCPADPGSAAGPGSSEPPLASWASATSAGGGARAIRVQARKARAARCQAS